MIRLITGGARSGKSEFAEKELLNKKDVLYIATAKVEDSEMEERVHQHKIRRPKSWGLFEGDKNLSSIVSNEYDFYLLDCITVLCSNYLFNDTKGFDNIEKETLKIVEDKIWKELENFIDAIRCEGKTLYIVTNEIGSSPVPMHAITRAFRDIQGRINQKLGQKADEVFLVVCSIPVRIK